MKHDCSRVRLRKQLSTAVYAEAYGTRQGELKGAEGAGG